MKVLAVVHMGPPSHNAGSELMLHTMLRHLVDHGHDCRAIVTRGGDRVYQGVRYTSVEGVAKPSRVRAEGAAWADVIVTHLDLTRDAMRLAADAGKPIVHLVHNHNQLTFHKVTAKSCDLAVMNSRWLAERLDWRGPQIIVRPPVRQDDYCTTSGDHTTMVNLTHSKGCEVFYEMARRRWRTDQFLGVHGAYGHQIIRPMVRPDGSDVIEFAPHTSDMRGDVYARTRVLLMPSDYESWGRVAVEALCSGIPVIAHPTEGLTESLGSAGIFCDRVDLDAWERALADLDDPDRYAEASAAALARAAELEDMTRTDLAGWETALHRLVA